MSRELQEQAKNAIDDTWKYSWHWDKRHEYLTLKGWRQALHDAEKQAEYFESRARKIRGLMPRMTKKINEDQRLEDES